MAGHAQHLLQHARGREGSAMSCNGTDMISENFYLDEGIKREEDLKGRFQ
jgi:hypothetical protein